MKWIRPCSGEDSVVSLLSLSNCCSVLTVFSKLPSSFSVVVTKSEVVVVAPYVVGSVAVVVIVGLTKRITRFSYS